MDNSKLVSDLSGILEGLDSSQEQLEKDAFDVINSSDTSLNLVKESISSSLILAADSSAISLSSVIILRISSTLEILSFTRLSDVSDELKNLKSFLKTLNSLQAL